LQGAQTAAQFNSINPKQTELRRADSLRAVVQLKNILSEVMSMSNQGDMSESDDENLPEYQDETKELKVKVIPHCCPLNSMDDLIFLAL
jgi:hypothetical protein